MDFGILWDVGIHIEAPLVLADNRAPRLRPELGLGLRLPGQRARRRPPPASTPRTRGWSADGILPSTVDPRHGRAQLLGRQPERLAVHAAELARLPGTDAQRVRVAEPRHHLGAVQPAPRRHAPDVDARLRVASSTCSTTCATTRRTRAATRRSGRATTSSSGRRTSRSASATSTRTSAPGTSCRSARTAASTTPSPTGTRPRSTRSSARASSPGSSRSPGRTRAPTSASPSSSARAPSSTSRGAAPARCGRRCPARRSACDPASADCRPGIDYNIGDTKAFPYPGVTETQQYGSFGGNLGLNVQVGKFARFRGLFGLLIDEPHYITYSGTGIDRNGDGRVDSGDPAEANVLYRDAIDAPGRRFKVEGTRDLVPVPRRLDHVLARAMLDAAPAPEVYRLSMEKLPLAVRRARGDRPRRGARGHHGPRRAQLVRALGDGLDETSRSSSGASPSCLRTRSGGRGSWCAGAGTPSSCRSAPSTCAARRAATAASRSPSTRSRPSRRGRAGSSCARRESGAVIHIPRTVEGFVDVRAAPRRRRPITARADAAIVVRRRSSRSALSRRRRSCSSRGAAAASPRPCSRRRPRRRSRPSSRSAFTRAWRGGQARGARAGGIAGHARRARLRLRGSGAGVRPSDARLQPRLGAARRARRPRGAGRPDRPPARGPRRAP